MVISNFNSNIFAILCIHYFLESKYKYVWTISRKDSVYNCLKETTADIVIIHDDARPAIKPNYIDRRYQYYKRICNM